MPIRNFLRIWTISGLLAFASCQEKLEAPLPAGIDQSHLSMHAWQLDRVTVQVLPSTIESDITSATLDNCERDDLVSFPQGAPFRHQEGSISCNGGGRSVFRSLDGAQWSYTDQDSTLTIEKGFNKQVFKMVTLHARVMHVHQTKPDYFGNDTRYHFYFSAK